MKILLISPNTLTVPYPVYPLGLDYVAGAVAAEHQVKIVDLNVEPLESLGKIIENFSPEIIGLSCRNIDNTEADDPRFFIYEYQKVVSWLKRRTEAITVCGGSGFTILPEAVFAELGVDYGIIGEGERFALLVEAVNRGEDPANIPGVISKSGPQWTAPGPWPGTTVRLFRRDFAHNRYYRDRGGMFNLQSKRGCPFSCIYCPYPHIEGNKHRLLPPAEVAQTALSLQEAGARYLFITDSAFNSDSAHSLAVARAFQQAGITIPWGGFFAPVKPPEDYFQIMAASGLTHVEFGTESLSDAMLASYRKPFRCADVLAAHEAAIDAGLHAAHYFLLGGPGESATTVNDCLDNIEKLKKTVLFFFAGIRVYPHTRLFDIALAEGKINRDTDLLKPFFYRADAVDLDEITDMVGQRAKKRINWIIGSGGAKAAAVVARMHDRGYAGPLWEYLVRI